MFEWNKPIAKARGIHPVDKRITIMDIAPIEIVRTPNRRQIEEIINGLCMVVSELAYLQEQAAQRIIEVQKMIASAPKEEANGTTEPVQTRDPAKEATTRKRKPAKRAAKKKPAEPSAARV